MAIGAISALTEADIQITQQISAIGFDDNPQANFIKPKLNTIRYPIEEVGRRAAKLALTLLNDKNEEDSDKEGKEENQEIEKIAKEELFFIPNLIERASVADLTKQ